MGYVSLVVTSDCLQTNLLLKMVHYKFRPGRWMFYWGRSWKDFTNRDCSNSLGPCSSTSESSSWEIPLCTSLVSVHLGPGSAHCPPDTRAIPPVLLPDSIGVSAGTLPAQGRAAHSSCLTFMGRLLASPLPWRISVLYCSTPNIVFICTLSNCLMGVVFSLFFVLCGELKLQPQQCRFPSQA